MKENWKYKKLGEVCNVINGLWTGKNPPFINVAVIRNTNFSKDCKLKLDDVAYIDVEEKQFKTRKLQYGDIIVEKSGGSDKQSVGRAIYFDKNYGNYSFSNFTSTLRVIDSNEVNSSFLQKVLLSKYNNGVMFGLQSKTTGLHNLDMKGFLRLSIPIPPLAIQQQIVAELDTLSGIIEKQKEQLTELDKLAQATFYDMFGDPVTNEKGWEVKKISDIAELKAGKSIKANELYDEYHEGLFPCYGGNGIRGYIEKKSHNGNFPIIGRQGALCGNVNYAQGTFYATEHAVVVTPKINLDTIWLYYALLNMNLNQYAKGVAQPGLSVQNITPLPIPVPPLPLQQSFASKVEAIEKQKELINKSISESQRLFESRMEYWLGD